MKQTAVEWLFKNIWLNPPENLYEILDQAKEMEKQQKDDCAIEFVNWISFTDYSTIDNTTKELLEIFKKEKGL